MSTKRVEIQHYKRENNAKEDRISQQGTEAIYPRCETKIENNSGLVNVVLFTIDIHFSTVLKSGFLRKSVTKRVRKKTSYNAEIFEDFLKAINGVFNSKTIFLSPVQKVTFVDSTPRTILRDLHTIFHRISELERPWQIEIRALEVALQEHKLRCK
jgi:hypothetical protein